MTSKHPTRTLLLAGTLWVLTSFVTNTAFGLPVPFNAPDFSTSLSLVVDEKAPSFVATPCELQQPGVLAPVVIVPTPDDMPFPAPGGVKISIEKYGPDDWCSVLPDGTTGNFTTNIENTHSFSVVVTSITLNYNEEILNLSDFSWNASHNNISGPTTNVTIKPALGSQIVEPGETIKVSFKITRIGPGTTTLDVLNATLPEGGDFEDEDECISEEPIEPTLHGIDEALFFTELETPEDFVLEQNFPNPFNPSTAIRFYLPASNEVNLSVYDSQGRLINELHNGSLEAGSHEFMFDASGLPSGSYFYSIRSTQFNQTRLMTLLK